MAIVKMAICDDCGRMIGKNEPILEYNFNVIDVNGLFDKDASEKLIEDGLYDSHKVICLNCAKKIMGAAPKVEEVDEVEKKSQPTNQEVEESIKQEITFKNDLERKFYRVWLATQRGEELDELAAEYSTKKHTLSVGLRQYTKKNPDIVEKWKAVIPSGEIGETKV